MRAKLGYIASAVLSLLLCAVMLGGSVLPVMAEETGLPSLDYSNPTMENFKSLSAYDLYTRLLERTPTEGEKLYWQAHEISLNYSDFIPDSCIDTNYDGDSGVLNVIVHPYSYTAANDATVTWIPEELSLDGKTYGFQEKDGVYTARVENCFYSANFRMKVNFGCEIEIARSIIEALRTEAYNEGASALEKMTAYRKQLAVYEALLADHNIFEAYEKYDRDYADYLSEKAVYDELKKVYDAYMVEYNAYQTVLDAYNQWQNFFAQEKAYAANEKPYAEYMDYYRVYKAAVDKLAMFESIFKKEDRGWCMYNDIMGNAVTEVLAKQELLLASGCNKNDIYLAGDATENLRVLLKGYNDLRTKKWGSDHAKYQALYKYYTDNYEALKQNFCDLYKTLKGLYENDVVSEFIAMKGKSEHYRQLVGHLFVVSTALDQSGHRNEAVWRIDGKGLMDVIREVHYFADGDWDPKNTPFPQTEVPKVERIEKPVRPTVEQVAREPEAPAEVPNPGPGPQEPQKPAGSRPTQRPQPLGDRPQRPVFSEGVELLWQEIEAGTLTEDQEYVRPMTLKLTGTVERDISIQNLKTVTFYNADGTVYQSVSVDYGGSVICTPLYRETTAEYSYEWLRWIRVDGSEPNTEVVTENIALYPLYRATKRTYTITWVLDGQSYPVSLYYGATPIPELFVDIHSYETQYYRYEFSGWDHEVTPVTGDDTYVGSILKIPKTFTVTWVIKDQTFTEQWEYGQTPVFKGELTLSTSTHVSVFQGWNQPIVSVSGDVTYKAIYQETPLAIGGKDTVMEVLHSETEIKVLATKSSVQIRQAAALAKEQGKMLTVDWEGILSVSMQGQDLKNYIQKGCPTLMLNSREDGNALIYELEYVNAGAANVPFPQISVRFAHSKGNGRETVFEKQVGNTWERLESNEMTADSSFIARRVYAYSVIPNVNENCNVSQIIDQAAEGEWVSLAVDCAYGYKVVGATIVTAEGETVTVTGLSFQMPASPITVTFHVEEIIYRVIFKVDGKVWHTAEYRAGDEILLPENPTKAPNGDFVYTFIGWGNVPAIAMGENEELVFEASFMESKTVSDYDTGNNNNVMITIVLPCVLAAIVLLVVFLIVNRIVRKRGGWKKFFHKIGVWIQALSDNLIDAISNLFQPKQKK